MARIDLSLVSSSSGVFPSRSRWRAAGQRDGRIEVPRSGLLGGVVLPIHMTSSAAVLDEVTHKFCRRPIVIVPGFGGVEDLLQNLPKNLIPLRAFYRGVASLLLFPILLLGRLKLPTFIGFSDKLSILETYEDCLHRADRGRVADIFQNQCGDVPRRAGQVANKLKQADSLRHARRQSGIVLIFLESLADIEDILLLLGGDVALDKLIDLVERHQRADGLVR